MFLNSSWKKAQNTFVSIFKMIDFIVSKVIKVLVLEGCFVFIGMSGWLRNYQRIRICADWLYILILLISCEEIQ